MSAIVGIGAGKVRIIHNGPIVLTPTEARALAQEIIECARDVEETATTQPRPPQCAMRDECKEPVTHLDKSGFVYCAKHGAERRSYEPCRKLRGWEQRRVELGKTIERY